jgi:cation-transporting ATPase 13A3/4/5
VSVGISENRLNQKHIACANSEDILVAGKVTRAFFDKTGTLTRQGLDFISAKCRATWEDNNESTTDLSADLTLAMACCHGLTRSQQTGDLIGNPVDRTMFEASGAAILSDVQGSSKTIVDRYGTTVEVVKYFDFDHHRMSQSVIAKRPDGSLIAFVKGSCEKLQQLCLPESLPNNYESVVRESAKSGTYQISVACKVIPQHTDVNLISRDDVERDLSFVGVINFKNSLREETPEVIRHLEAGEVKCVMVTGDSLLTGIRIAKESGMIKEGLSVLSCSKVEHSGVFAWLDENHIQVDLPPIEHLKSGDADVELGVTGDVWEELRREDPLQASELAHAIRVYGRCTPFDKVSVVSTFVEMGFITLMVGDGGNDCGALKTAHVGIALSDAEASMVSPFTSLSKSIDSVAEILKEGRCALASALASYKYVIIYGQIEALTNIIMAYFRINLTEYAWVFIDGFWVIGMSFTLPLAKAARHLSQTRPTSSLLGPHTVSSVMGILCLNVVFTFVSIGILFSQDWFQCRKWSNEDVSNLLVIGDNVSTGPRKPRKVDKIC